MPEISIITPAYLEREEQLDWLDECIQSVMSQSFVDWEMIIINDASPVDINPVRVKYQNEGRIRWYDASHNQGPSKIRNTAVELAKSDCLLPLDADDRLATTASLNTLFRHYNASNGQEIIYGNLQRIEKQDKIWITGKTIELWEYSFDQLIDLRNSLGIIPVTAMHSRECHVKAGGWKADLGAALEDVEYFIAAGKAGFCGKRIPEITLLYRKSEESRWGKSTRNIRDDMISKIVQIHSDLYRGEYPMGCCGKSSVQVNQVNQFAMSSLRMPNGQQIEGMLAVSVATELDGYPESEKVWVQYQGGKMSSWQVHVRNPDIKYNIIKTGHMFQVHKNHGQFFGQLERGRGFLVGLPSPLQLQEAEKPTPPPANNGTPVLARLVRLDQQTLQDRGTQEKLPEIIPGLKPLSVAIPSPNPININNVPLDALDQIIKIPPSVISQLEMESWTIEKLAKASPDDLLGYRQVGLTRAGQIIEAAKKWLEPA